MIYALINKGESLVDARQNLYSFRQAIEKGSFEANFGRGNAPTGLKDLIRAMVKRYPHHRITIPEIQNSAYFDNILISTIKFLDSFVEKTQIEKAQFLKGLTRVLPQFSERLISRKILPSLLNELKDKLMVRSYLNLMLLPVFFNFLP